MNEVDTAITKQRRIGYSRIVGETTNITTGPLQVREGFKIEVFW